MVIDSGIGGRSSGAVCALTQVDSTYLSPGSCITVLYVQHCVIQIAVKSYLPIINSLLNLVTIVPVTYHLSRFLTYSHIADSHNFVILRAKLFGCGRWSFVECFTPCLLSFFKSVYTARRITQCSEPRTSHIIVCTFLTDALAERVCNIAANLCLCCREIKCMISIETLRGVRI